MSFSSLDAPMSQREMGMTLPWGKTQTDRDFAVCQGKAEHLGIESYLYMSHFTTDINTCFQA